MTGISIPQGNKFKQANPWEILMLKENPFALGDVKTSGMPAAIVPCELNQTTKHWKL